VHERPDGCRSDWIFSYDRDGVVSIHTINKDISEENNNSYREVKRMPIEGEIIHETKDSTYYKGLQMQHTIHISQAQIGRNIGSYRTSIHAWIYSSIKKD